MGDDDAPTTAPTDDEPVSAVVERLQAVPEDKWVRRTLQVLERTDSNEGLSYGDVFNVLKHADGICVRTHTFRLSGVIPEREMFYEWADADGSVHALSPASGKMGSDDGMEDYGVRAEYWLKKDVEYGDVDVTLVPCEQTPFGGDSDG